MDQSKKMARIAYRALEEKKGGDVKLIDISTVSIMADYFLIADGANENQVRAMADNVEEELARAGHPLKQREGYGTGKWILLDFGDIIVHVFDKENRLFYDLERIWRDGKAIAPEEIRE